MVFHMKTTLLINDQIMLRLKERAARQGTTISQLVESALRMLLLQDKGKKEKLPPLPSFNGGECFVDVSDREALYRVMEQR